MTDVDAEEEAETPERLAAAVDVAMRAPNLAQIMDELELLLGPFLDLSWNLPAGADHGRAGADGLQRLPAQPGGGEDSMSE